MNGAVVLTSGGLDSSVLLHQVVREYGAENVRALSFFYGQRHAIELECAEAQAEAAGVETHVVLDIGFMGALLAPGSTLLAAGDAVPDLKDLSEADLAQPPTYVPNRNMMLLSMAAAYAEAQGCSRVYYGAQAQDEYGYWDCTETFLERINGVLALNRKTPVQVLAPLVHHSKADNVRLGVELGIDFAQTWTCYRGLGNDTVAVSERRGCGTCPSCVERIQAFKAVGVTDPLDPARS
ncbi:MAG: 7-cyano-7-deazaguanine synthase QueC [Candidatus Hydrogenedens sp.]|nr:7-cyano-7-deazaguanine synthase QueC [Candidatus Hydrogenedens sp.]